MRGREETFPRKAIYIEVAEETKCREYPSRMYEPGSRT